ncbi:MAG: hypothetical protein IKJ99_00170 [Oscillospiraceae bacterium]|nr:hypothetical protein [Oscillospiraceae bacterium]
MKRKMFSIVAALLALTMLAGCSQIPTEQSDDSLTVMGTEVPAELTAEGVYEAMKQAVNGRLATSFTSTTEMSADLTAAILSMGAKVSAVTDIRLCEDPFRFYSASTIGASCFGIDVDESVQIYSSRDDSGLTNYFHLDSADKWLRQKLTMVPADLLGQYAVTGCDKNWKPENLALTSRTETGYVLTGTFSAEDVLTAVVSPFGELDLSKVDLTGIRLDTVYHVDASTFLPTKIEIAYSGFGEIFTDLFNKYAGQFFNTFGAKVNADVTTYRETLSDLRYDEAEIPEVPEAGVQNSTDIKQFNIMEYINRK